MSNLFNSLRQLRYPREFRIAPPVWSPDLLQALLQLVNRSATPDTTPPIEETASTQMLADVATHLWRLRKKMLQPGSEQPLEEMRSAYRTFEYAWNALRESGVEIHEHEGSPFHAGLHLNTLAFQPTPGILQETVIETVRPSIYYKQQLLQAGEVIVGTPETEIHPTPASESQG